METKNIESAKAFLNIGVLDIRKASEESVARIRRILNVGRLIYAPETASLIPRLHIGNLGSSIEVPADAELKILSGRLVFGRDYFKNQIVPLRLVVNGQVIVNPDVPEADIEKGLGDLILAGQLICPEHLEGVIQSKLRHFNGRLLTYAPSSRIAVGTLILDENYLHSHDDGAKLVVIGNLNLPQVVSNSLFKQKVQKIQVVGWEVICHEENAQLVRACLDDKAGTAKVKIIPAGFFLVEKPLVLDADLLETLPARKLYCTQRVQIEKGVTPEELEEHLEALIAKDRVICPAGLKRVLSRKCNMLETDVLFYEGELWFVDDELTLLASRFDYMEDKATLVIDGELILAPDIHPQVLAERLAKVHNWGAIRCTPAQMSAIQARLGFSEGGLSLVAPTEEESEGSTSTGTAGDDMEVTHRGEERMLNAAYLAL